MNTLEWILKLKKILSIYDVGLEYTHDQEFLFGNTTQPYLVKMIIPPKYTGKEQDIITAFSIDYNPTNCFPKYSPQERLVRTYFYKEFSLKLPKFDNFMIQ